MQLQYRQRSSAWWGALATAAIHALLWGGWQLAARQEAAPAAPATHGPVLAVRLLAARAPVPRPVPAAPTAPAAAAPLAARDAIQRDAIQRDAIHYHYPEEVERELILRRDPAAEQAIALPRPVVLELLVGADGRVNAVLVEDAALEAALQEQLRTAFMGLVFLPAMKNGQPVAARMRIEVEARAGAPSAAGRSHDAQVIEGQR